MPFDWDKLFKRYVADDVKTPYFVAAERLTGAQARHELFAYTLLIGVLFGVVGVASISTELPHQGALVVPVYAWSVVGAAIVLGMTKHAWAAVYCAGAPIAALLYFLLFGFHPNLGSGDQTLLIVILVIWLRYGLRVIAIAKAYPDMSSE